MPDTDTTGDPDVNGEGDASSATDPDDVVLTATEPPVAVDPEFGIDAETEIEIAATKRLGPIGWLAIGWLVLVAVMAIAPGIFPFGELGARDIEALRNDEGVSIAHPFGFDSRGSDLATRVIYGSRASVIVSVGSITFGLVFGGILGLISGYFKGRLDTFIVNVFNVMLAVPALVLALTLATVFASGDDVSYARRLLVVTLAIGIVSVPILGRITRASTLTWSEREFVVAAKAMGARSHRIIIREVLPNVLPAMFSITLLGMAIAIITEGGLAVIGVGIPAELNTPSWGNLIATGRSQMLLGSPNQIIGPSIFIFLTVLSLNYLGDVVRARFDVRESVL